jgi:hypothetical protein
MVPAVQLRALSGLAFASVLACDAADSRPQALGAPEQSEATGPAVSSSPPALPPEGPVGMGEANPTAAIFAYSDVTDEAPSLVRVFAGHSDIIWECDVVFPGNVPMTARANPVVCEKTNLGEDLLVSVRYPDAALPPRTVDSPVQAPPWPAPPPPSCEREACSTTPLDYEPMPPYPHVQIHILSSVAQGVTLMVEGNGRKLSMPVQLHAPGEPGFGVAATYLNVDAVR